MKYGESLFDLCYLLFAVGSGAAILLWGRGRAQRLMGLAALLLGLGDAFHLVPRVIRYFSTGDLTAALGIGKLITSLTMTLFYVLLYRLWLAFYRRAEKRPLSVTVYLLLGLRVLLCLLPQNRWLENGESMVWGTVRNLPFLALGVIVIALYRGVRREHRGFRLLWLYMTLSFLFYLPVAVGAGKLPILGMLMLPKTVCYILILIAFDREVFRKGGGRP